MNNLEEIMVDLTTDLTVTMESHIGTALASDGEVLAQIEALVALVEDKFLAASDEDDEEESDTIYFGNMDVFPEE